MEIFINIISANQLTIYYVQNFVKYGNNKHKNMNIRKLRKVLSQESQVNKLHVYLHQSYGMKKRIESILGTIYDKIFGTTLFNTKIRKIITHSSCDITCLINKFASVKYIELKYIWHNILSQDIGSAKFIIDDDYALRYADSTHMSTICKIHKIFLHQWHDPIYIDLIAQHVPHIKITNLTYDIISLLYDAILCHDNTKSLDVDVCNTHELDMRPLYKILATTTTLKKLTINQIIPIETFAPCVQELTMCMASIESITNIIRNNNLKTLRILNFRGSLDEQVFADNYSLTHLALNTMPTPPNIMVYLKRNKQIMDNCRFARVKAIVE